MSNCGIIASSTLITIAVVLVVVAASAYWVAFLWWIGARR